MQSTGSAVVLIACVFMWAASILLNYLGGYIEQMTSQLHLS